MPRTTREPAMADEVHDKRPRHWFWIDNHVLDLHMPTIGVHGLALYVLLARYANYDGQAFPGLRTLARHLGISRMTVLKYLDILEIAGLIHRNRRPSKQGDADSNLYTLLAIPGDATSGGPTSGPRGQSIGPRVVQPVDHGGPPSGPEGDLLKGLKKGEEERSRSLPTVEIFSGTGNEPPVPEASVARSTISTPSRKKASITPLPTDDWIYEQLLIYRTDFDLDALNDEEWWANLANSFPVFEQTWVKMAFASLARWLMDNPRRRPRSRRGWHERISFSLNWYYDKHVRRLSNGCT